MAAVCSAPSVSVGVSLRSSFVSKGAAARSARPALARPNVSKVVMRTLHRPGVVPPAYLDGTLAADYGFDPLGLAKEPVLLKRFTEAEVFHCRLAMLAWAGCLVPELQGNGNWADYANLATDAKFIMGLPPIVVPVDSLNLGLFHAVAIAEGSRLYGEIKYGYKGSIEPFTYPGLDPFGVIKGATPEEVKGWREKEIFNGRLAMISLFAYLVQYLKTGAGPLENLTAHIANPTAVNIFS